MKKIRYFPFGYHMVNGKIVIRPEESALLQELFSGYLNGVPRFLFFCLVFAIWLITQKEPGFASGKTPSIGTKI